MDRQFIARELGFIGGVCPNSMDAVSDRDYVLDTLYFTAVHMAHLSRWAEDLIIYSSGLFKFVQCSDAYATGALLQCFPCACRRHVLLILEDSSGVAAAPPAHIASMRYSFGACLLDGHGALVRCSHWSPGTCRAKDARSRLMPCWYSSAGVWKCLMLSTAAGNLL